MKQLHLLKSIMIVFMILSSAVTAEHIENFEVNITLEPSGEFVVTESILYDFNETKKHGIYREIPFKTYISGNEEGEIWGMWFDIGLDNFSVKMDGEKVAWTKSQEERMLFIKIGSESTWKSQKHLYTITYRCRNAIMPSSFSQDRDKFHWKAIGAGWSVPIIRSEVNLFLPNRLHKDNITLMNSSKEQKRSEWLNRHHLKFQTSLPSLTVFAEFPRGILSQSGEEKIKQGIVHFQKIAKEKATIDAENKAYKEQYLVSVELKKESRKIYGLLYWLLFFILLIFVWLKRDKLGLSQSHRSIVVRYVAPKDISILQAGLLWDKSADDEDFYASLLELAHLGHLSIEEKEKNIIFKKISKNSKYLSEDQHAVLHALFKNGTTFSTQKVQHEQRRKLHDEVSKIGDRLYDWALNEEYTVEHFSKAKWNFLKIILGVVLPLFAMTIYMATVKHYSAEGVTYLLFCGFVALLPVLIVSFFRISLLFKLMAIVFGIGFLGVLMTFKLFPMQSGILFLDVLQSSIMASLMIVVLSVVVYTRMGRYTAKGVAVQEHLKGLEMFMRLVKEDELKRRIEEEPEYMEKLLPYAMLFGHIDHWLKMYDLLKVPSPKWSKGSLSQTMHNSFLHASNKHTTTSNYGTYSVSSSSGSSSSSSYGGGAGGGGGGSW
ncbi:MAG: DUF2207 domain-containing protein [Campylobacterota bacterium]|nr:DUF2207 domain-containing protein [Campylobacterota bacterium]